MIRKMMLTVLSFLLIITLVGCSSKKTQPDEQYAYNTEILTNAAAPVPGEPDIAAIEGYAPIEIEGVELPFTVPDTTIEVLSIGAYTGSYVEDNSDDPCTDTLAVVIRNAGNKVISYSDFSILYSEDEEKIVGFVPTNIPVGCCAVVLCSDKELTTMDVTRFEVKDSKQIVTDSLKMIQGTVGVDYTDNRFIVTNLTDSTIGTVYVRYKQISSGNVFLGGATRSVNTARLSAYETEEIYISYDRDRYAIISVENAD